MSWLCGGVEEPWRSVEEEWWVSWPCGEVEEKKSSLPEANSLLVTILLGMVLERMTKKNVLLPGPWISSTIQTQDERWHISMENMAGVGFPDVLIQDAHEHA